jgi:hypothetical protein
MASIGKLSLLDMTQNILSSMDSDEVNSINDTVEALQVAEVVRETFFDVFSNLNLPCRTSLIQLDAVNDVDRPNYLKIPETVKQILWVKYNWRESSDADYRVVEYLDPERFVERQMTITFDTTINDFSGVKIPIFTDRHPQFFTTFDNSYLCFEGYNNSADSTLQKSQSLAYGYVYPSFLLEDDFVPELDANYFPMLLSEAKSTCFVNFKQESNSKEEQRARRGRMRVQNDLWKASQKDNSGPDYGRKRR